MRAKTKKQRPRTHTQCAARKKGSDTYRDVEFSNESKYSRIRDLRVALQRPFTFVENRAQPFDDNSHSLLLFIWFMRLFHFFSSSSRQPWRPRRDLFEWVNARLWQTCTRFSILQSLFSGEALSCKKLLLPFIFRNEFSLSFFYTFLYGSEQIFFFPFRVQLLHSFRFVRV